MKSVFAFLTIALTSPLALGAHPWTDVVGCFKTLTRNGKVVNPNGMQSTIRDTDDLQVITDEKGNKLGGLEMIIVQGYDAGNDEAQLDFQTALTDRGTYTEVGAERRFAFDGPVKFQDMPTMRVKANVSVQWLSNSQLALKTKRVVVGTGGIYDTDDSYVLEKAVCE